MPLDLHSLRQGDDAEWDRAFDELELWDVAKRAVSRKIVAHFGLDVEDIAQAAILELSRSGIRRCRNVSDIAPMLRRISGDRAVDFLRKKARHALLRLGPQQLLPIQGEDNVERLLRRIAEELRIETGDLTPFVLFLVKECHMDVLDEAILREHILGGMKQRKFAQAYGISLGALAGRKRRLIVRIRELPAVRALLRD